MISKQSILILLAFILAGIIAIEVIVLINSSKEKQADTITSHMPTLAPTVQPQGDQSTDDYGSCDLQTCSAWFPSPAPNQAISELQLVSLRDLKQGIITASSIRYVFEGTVSKVEYQEVNGINSVSFIITNNEQQNTFIFEKEFTTIRKNGEDQGFAALQDGMQIRGDVDFDLIDQFYNKVTIEILQ